MEGTPRRNRVLVVDDNPSIFRDFQTILRGTIDVSDLDEIGKEIFGHDAPFSPQAHSYDLDYASQGEEGLECVRKALAEGNPYCVAFVDMRMPPGWDGLETIEQIWKADPDIQIVLCTAYSDHSWEDVCERIGITDKFLILKKPFDSAEVSQLTCSLATKWHLHKKASLKMEEMDCLVEERSRALVEAHERFRALLEQAVDAIFTFDLRGRFLDVNQQACRILGCTNDELRRLRVQDIELSAGLLEHARRFSAKDEHQTPITFESEYIRQNGGAFPVEIRLGPIHLNQQQVFLAISRDISERRKAEEERRRLDAKMLHVQKLDSLHLMAGAIAHSLNNMLLVILGNHELMTSDLPQNSPLHRYLAQSERAAERAAELSAMMLTYVGKGRESTANVDLRAVVGEVLDTMGEALPGGITLERTLQEELPAVRGDFEQLRQMCLNLISNAIEAIEPGTGLISVRCELEEFDEDYLQQTALGSELPAGPYVTLEVSDSGCGMDEKTIERIFDPFFTTKFPGRGLGLAAVFGVLRGHDGTVSVHSEAGKGTRIKVLLPPSTKPKPSPKEEVREVDYEGSGTVLLIDPEQAVREVGKQLLERLGFRALVAASGSEGIQVFREHRSEIRGVILDLSVHNEEGWEAFNELRSLQNDLCVLISSGFREERIREQFKGLQDCVFVQKPYRTGSLIRCLRQALPQ